VNKFLGVKFIAESLKGGRINIETGLAANILM
jgi:hypothetical protein